MAEMSIILHRGCVCVIYNMTVQRRSAAFNIKIDFGEGKGCEI